MSFSLKEKPSSCLATVEDNSFVTVKDQIEPASLGFEFQARWM